ncbi:MAG: sigma-54-dependent Fis family transcriptional regulator [Cyclobacteriaceae bacterium]|nr:sigma-54-dependent Fis family transcriptional regulator [Cyclobacteriaceae bacterium HetDA_MAG_MS6]
MSGVVIKFDAAPIRPPLGTVAFADVLFCPCDFRCDFEEKVFADDDNDGIKNDFSDFLFKKTTASDTILIELIKNDIVVVQISDDTYGLYYDGFAAQPLYVGWQADWTAVFQTFSGGRYQVRVTTTILGEESVFLSRYFRLNTFDILSADKTVKIESFQSGNLENSEFDFTDLIDGGWRSSILDMNLTKGENDGSDGLRNMRLISENSPSTEIIPITAYGEIDLVVKSMKLGARDFLTKPWSNNKLFEVISSTLKLRESREHKVIGQPNATIATSIIGTSNQLRKVMDIVEKVAPTDASVLITGENGTGKDLIARKLHELSQRSGLPFISVDMGAMSSSLFESELFGHHKGAFTDAKSDRIGKLESADGGTIFLDEIGNLPLSQQAKLLTAIQKKEVTPVGANQPKTIDVRFIAATNADINNLVKKGDFREDLLYRLNTIEIALPALRERVEDITLLLQHFLAVYTEKYDKPYLKIDEETLEVLAKYQWPGNVRELQHRVERAVILSEQKKLYATDFNLVNYDHDDEEILNIQQMEKSLILKALEKNNGNITHAAKDLGIDRLALYRRLEKYGL